MRFAFLLLALLLAPVVALAQGSVLQVGPITKGHAAAWADNGYIRDAGVGFVGPGLPFCINSSQATPPIAPYYSLCFGASPGAITFGATGTTPIPFAVTTDGQLSILAGGSATIGGAGPLNLVSSGVVYPFPTPAIATSTTHLPTEAALAAYTVSVTTLIRDGFFNAGDSQPVTYTLTSGACSLNAGAGDAGSQVPFAGAGTFCWKANFQGMRVTSQIWGAAGDGVTDDTTKVQAAINGAIAASVPLYFDSKHLYNITSTLNVTSPIDIEGQYRYAGWVGSDPTGATGPSCPWGLFNNATNINLLNVSAVTATIRGLCIQMSSAAGIYPTSGIAMKFAPPSGQYQSGLNIEQNTIIRPFDGIAVGGTVDAACCGKSTSADGNAFNRNTILQPADEGISNGKFTTNSATAGNTYTDNTIICHTITGAAPANSVGFAFYDGGIDYDGTINGPEGCNIGFAIKPGSVSGVGQFAAGVFRGVFGDQSGTHDLLIQPTSALATVADIQSTGSWAATTGNSNSILIDCSSGSCFNVSFVQLTAHGGAALSQPIIKLISSSNLGLFDFTLADSSFCGYVGSPPVAGAEALDITLANAITGRFVITGNRFNTCPGNGVPVGIALHLSAGATGTGPPTVPNIIIANNDFSKTLEIGGTPISYTPNNEAVIIHDNMGIDNDTGTVADAATIALPTASVPNFGITGTGTTITALGGSSTAKWWANGVINMFTPTGAITFGTGGNICNALTSSGAGGWVVGRWNVAGNCFNLK